MAMQPVVRYINDYVSGTCAPQPEKKPENRTSASQLPPVKRQQKWLICVDMAALGGILATVVLSVFLIVGLVQMNQAQQEALLQAIQAEEDKTQDKLKEKVGVVVAGGKNW